MAKNKDKDFIKGIPDMGYFTVPVPTPKEMIHTFLMQIGYSLDEVSFTMEPTEFKINGICKNGLDKVKPFPQEE